MNNANISDIAERIKTAKNAVVLCHARPDGDAVGSAFALCEIIRTLGAKCAVLCADDVPARLRALSDGEGIGAPADAPDTVITVDVASPEQLGDIKDEWIEKVDIKIDHHAVSPDFGKLRHVEPDAAAAGEIVYLIAEQLGVMSPKIASRIFGAVSSDTGSFKYSNVTKRTFDIAAALVSCGAETARISGALYENKPMSEVVACGQIYSNMKSAFDGRMLYVSLTNEMKKKYGFTDDDLGNASSLLREIAGVDLACAIKQDSTDGKKFRVSMRSGERVDCAALCALIGGGGHIRASGCTVYADSVQDAEKQILDLCGKVFSE